MKKLLTAVMLICSMVAIGQTSESEEVSSLKFAVGKANEIKRTKTKYKESGNTIEGFNIAFRNARYRVNIDYEVITLIGDHAFKFRDDLKSVVDLINNKDSSEKTWKREKYTIMRNNMGTIIYKDEFNYFYILKKDVKKVYEWLDEELKTYKTPY